MVHTKSTPIKCITATRTRSTRLVAPSSTYCVRPFMEPMPPRHNSLEEEEPYLLPSTAPYLEPLDPELQSLVDAEPCLNDEDREKDHNQWLDAIQQIIVGEDEYLWQDAQAEETFEEMYAAIQRITKKD